MLLSRKETIELLKANVPDLATAEVQVEDSWEGVCFAGLLGDVLVQGDIVVPDVMKFIELLAPIMHHKPVDSFERRIDASHPELSDLLLFDNVDNIYSLQKQQEVTRLLKKLQDEQILEICLLEFLAGWRTLEPTMRDRALNVLVKCNLLAENENVSPRISLLAVCRLSNEDFLDPSNPREATKEGRLLVRYKMRFIPAGLFPRFQALLLLDRGSTIVPKEVTRAELKLGLKTVLRSASDSNFEEVLVRVINWHWQKQGKRTNQQLVGIEICCSSMTLLCKVICTLEQLIRESFVGLDYSTQLWFTYTYNSLRVCKWKIPAGAGTLDSILKSLRFNSNLSVDARMLPEPVINDGPDLCPTGKRDESLTLYVPLASIAVGMATPLFFLSHKFKWGQNDAAVSTFQELLEKRSPRLFINWLAVYVTVITSRVNMNSNRSRELVGTGSYDSVKQVPMLMLTRLHDAFLCIVC